MKLEQWVLFIDMLGYREINGQINDDKKADEFLEFMKSNEKIFEDQNNIEIRKSHSSGAFNLYKYYEIQTTFVSDSLIINYKPIEFIEEGLDNIKRLMHSANALFIIMNRLQTYIFNCLDKYQVLVRGGISNKYCMIKDNYAVGEGVIDAYYNESSRAIYPRIAISENIINNTLLVRSFNLISEKIYGTESFLKVDHQGVYYLDYLKYNVRIVMTTMAGDLEALAVVNGFFAVQKNVIEEKLKNLELKIKKEVEVKKLENIKKIRSKILWLKDYHDESIGEIAPHLRIDH